MNLLPATLTENGSCGPSKSTHMMEHNPRFIRGTKETGEGFRRVAAPEPERDLASPLHPHHHSVATQTSFLDMSPQLLEAILRSSDASIFSTEDLTRMQAGIGKQLVDRMRQASGPHQPVRTTDEAVQLPSEPEGPAEPYPTTGLQFEH